MLGEVGDIIVSLALAASIYAALAAFWSTRRTDQRWAVSSRNGSYAVMALLGLGLLILLVAFLQDQFQIRYVSEHSSRALPLYLKISSLWAGQEGSLLLWAFLQALFTALLVSRPSERSRALIPWAAVLMNVTTAFFVGVTLFLSNPFTRLPLVPTDGQGLNPLLRHPGMIFHPPAMYLGYVGLAVPFALAMAALITRRMDDWTAVSRRWTLVAWLFLGLGLLLGARWAYDVLGWGGYWGWDPVENAGLMPWFTATALLHGSVMQDERRGFRVWNVLLAVFSFLLVLFGTFTTRSGLIQSVHAFARSNLGPYFLAAMGVSLGLALALLYNARQSLQDSPPPENLLTRDGLFTLTLILFLTLTASVLIGSILPTITEATGGQRFEAGPAWFDRVTGPQFAAMALLIGVCPLLGRAAAALKRLRERGLLAVVGAVLVTAIAALAGFTQPVSLIGFAIVGLAGGTTLSEFVQDALARSRRGGEHFFSALGQLVSRHRRKYGGYLVHAGVILIALGIIGTRMYPFERDLVMSLGQPATAGDYTLVLEDFYQESADDHFSTLATLTVYRDNDYLVTLEPQIQQYPGFADQTFSVPALLPGLREDVYVVLAGWENSGATVTIKFFANALANFLWLGGLVFMAGGVVSAWPANPTAQLSPRQARQRTVALTLGIAVVLIVFGAAALAMWGPGHGTVEGHAGRPLAGQAAPDFTLTLLDGSSQFSLSEQRGAVVVLNFWASWCDPCVEELPALQAVHQSYSTARVHFVGLAYNEEPATVQQAIAQFGLTYPVGLDTGEAIASRYGVTGVPETFVVDPQGNVAYVHIGPVTAEQLAAEIDQLLAR